MYHTPMTKYLRYLSIICFIGVGIGAALFFMRTPHICTNLSCIQMQNISTFSRADTYTDTPSVYRALYTDKDVFLRIEAQKIPATDAESLISTDITRMKALFEKAPAPYPGDISDAIICDPKYVPVYRETTTPDGQLRYFTGYMNNRLTFGSCSQSEATYRGFMGFVYCKKTSLSIRVELMAPIDTFTKHEDTFTKQLLSLRCGSDD